MIYKTINSNLINVKQFFVSLDRIRFTEIQLKNFK